MLFAAAWLLFGALVLPALIYAVGQLLLGTYEGGLGEFYSNLYADLFAGSGRAAAIIVGPLVIMSLARLPFMGMKKAEDAPEAPEAPRENRSSARVEPRFGPE